MGWPRTTTVFPEPTWWNGDDQRPGPDDFDGSECPECGAEMEGGECPECGYVDPEVEEDHAL